MTRFFGVVNQKSKKKYEKSIEKSTEKSIGKPKGKSRRKKRRKNAAKNADKAQSWYFQIIKKLVDNFQSSEYNKDTKREISS